MHFGVVKYVYENEQWRSELGMGYSLYLTLGAFLFHTFLTFGGAYGRLYSARGNDFCGGK